MAEERILNFDIFRMPRSNRVTKLSKSAELILSDLQRSLRIIREETLNNKLKLEKMEVDVSDTVLANLETNLHEIMERNLSALQGNQVCPKMIRLGDLYCFACRNNATIKKYLNSFYLTSRVYKGLLKGHPIIQDLQFKLLNVRRKVILETYKNEIRKGKLHHLRGSKAVKIVSNIPKKLKYIVRKCNKEILKYYSKDTSVMNAKHRSEMRQLLGPLVDLPSKVVCDSVEESFIDYYGRLQSDQEKTESYIGSLREISEAQNMEGDQVLLNYCDQEMAMEYMGLDSEDVRKDFLAWDGLAIHGEDQEHLEERKDVIRVVEEEEHDDKIKNNKMKVETSRTIISLDVENQHPGNGFSRRIDSEKKNKESDEMRDQSKEGGVNEDLDIGDFDDFQLVDEWEGKCEDVTTVCKDVSKMEVVLPETATHIVKKEKEVGCGRVLQRIKRSRFGPANVEVLHEQPQQSRNLSLFSSTFVDENDEGSMKKSDSKEAALPVPSSSSRQICERVQEDDVVKSHVPLPLTQDSSTIAFKETVTLTAVDLSKTMLKQFQDSVNDVLVASAEGRGAKSSLGPWISGPAKRRTWSQKSVLVDSMTRNMYKSVENRMKTLIQESFLIDEKESALQSRGESSPKIDTPKAYSNATVTTNSPKLSNPNTSSKVFSPKLEHSPSPTVFDRTIEASMARQRMSSGTGAVAVVPRPPRVVDSAISPDKSRLRAIMLSYKRDLKKSKEGMQKLLPMMTAMSGDKNEEEMSQEGGSTGVEGGTSITTISTEVAQTNLPGNDGSAQNPQKEEEEGAKDTTEDGDDQSQEQSKRQRSTAEADNSEGELSSSGDEKMDKKNEEDVKQRQSRVKWLAKHADLVVSIPLPAPAAPFLENLVDPDDSQKWTGRKVFVVDAQGPKNVVAASVKEHLQINGACVFDSSNYKQAGKGLHVLMFNEWHFPSDPLVTAPRTSPVSLLFLKNNSGVHFLSYPDLDTVVRFDCATLFPHSRSCLFLDHHSLLNTHQDNVRNMLEFMITERETSDRVWCLKIFSGVYGHFCDKILQSEDESEKARLVAIQSILNTYSTKYQDEGSLSLVEVVTEEDDITKQQDQVLNQQYFLQRKFRHFCILTESLNTTELDMRFLSTYGIAVLPLRTFLTNKIKTFVS